jgi:starch phosphorylase
MRWPRWTCRAGGRGGGRHATTLEDLQAREPDAALGNGGLGRLAACFLDSMATLGLPSYGYGIRYEFGMFAQSIQGGRQVEHPDAWLEDGTPWEFPRWGVHYPVRFGGWVEPAAARPRPGVAARRRGQRQGLRHGDPRPRHRARQHAAPVEGRGAGQIDLQAFNSGDYARAAEFKNQFENISWVLYPNDSTPAGRELRLRQEYFFTSASIQDILARHLAEHGTLDNLADKVAIHLNDTHPAIGVAELMRLLVDEHGFAWAAAWAITQQVFSYTNHTLMPEALETWPVALMQHVLPRHLEIIFRINHEFLAAAAAHRPGDNGLPAPLSLIDENGERRVRMANLSIVGSHKVNGVSALHSTADRDHLRRLRQPVAERFTNMTNGVTPRRWLAQANPAWRRCSTPSAAAGGLIWTSWRGCASMPTTKPSCSAFRAVKHANKERLAGHHPQHHRHRGRPGQPVRRAGQAHPRIQAPAAQRAARGGALPGHAGRPGRRLGAAHGDLRRQGGQQLRHGQADHPADPRRGRRWSTTTRASAGG